ncbi:MAG: hypothetical protein O3A01_04725 [bacterium]|nr:hypothetical protein [bacterium]
MRPGLGPVGMNITQSGGLNYFSRRSHVQSEDTVKQRAQGYLVSLNIRRTQINTPNAHGQVPLEEALREMASTGERVDSSVIRGLVMLGANPAAMSSEAGKPLSVLADDLSELSGNTELKTIALFLTAMTQLKQSSEFSGYSDTQLDETVIAFLDRLYELGQQSTDLLVGADKVSAEELSASIKEMVMSLDNASDGTGSMKLTALLTQSMTGSGSALRAMIKAVAGSNRAWLPNAGQDNGTDHTVY